MINFKKLLLGALVTSMVCANAVTAFADEITADKSFTTSVYYDMNDKIPDEYKERAKFQNTKADDIDFATVDPKTLAVGVGLYTGLQFRFGIMEYLIVNNKDVAVPDLQLNEGSVDGQGNIGEGIRLYAINYNGTNTVKHVATVYNETAQTNLDAYNVANGTSEVLEVVPGSKVEYKVVPNTNNYIYQADIYFPEDFVYCDGIFAIDITNELKKYGGNGQNAKDGFDLVGLEACNVIRADITNYKADTENKIKQLLGKQISVVADSYKLAEEAEIKELYKLATGKYPDGTTGNNRAGDLNNEASKTNNTTNTTNTSNSGTCGNNTSNSGSGKVDSSPKTSDNSMLILLGAGLIVSAGLMTGVVVSKRRRY